MQKKLIALAIAGLSSAAFAQSNVTIYGVADATFDNVKASGATVAVAAQEVRFNRVSTNSSHIGFKGSEALGNGMTAVFQYESGVSFDAAGALAANRDSFVGLAGGYGTVVLGNLTGPTRAFGAAVDVNAGATGIGANAGLIGKLGNLLTGTLNTATVSGAATGQVTAVAANTRSATYASAYDNRFQNAIAYVSPTMGGFTAIVGYVANEGKAGTGATLADPSALDMGVKYNVGPVLVGLSYANVKLRNATATETKNTRLVASYTFGAASVRALWDQGKASTNTPSNVKQTVWGLGATYNVTGNGKLLGQYYTARDVTGSAALGGGSNTGAKLFELGYEHSLSKRTLLKATYAKLTNKSAAAYEFGVNGTGLVAGAAGADLTGVQVGVRHSF